MKRDIRKAVEEIKSAGMEDFLHQIQVLLNAMMIALQKLNVAMIVIAQEQDVLV